MNKLKAYFRKQIHLLILQKTSLMFQTISLLIAVRSAGTGVVSLSEMEQKARYKGLFTLCDSNCDKTVSHVDTVIDIRAIHSEMT